MGDFAELLRHAVSLLQDFPAQKTITAAEPVAPVLLRGLEAVLSDGLREGSSLWDFVSHSQHSMYDQNPDAEPQVNAVADIAAQAAWAHSSLWKGRLWLLRSLTTHTLKDALHSLTTFYATDIRQSYYQPWAFLQSPDGLQFIRDVGRVLHVMRFRLTASDLHLFDPCTIPCSAPCHGTRWGHRGDACAQCGLLFRRSYRKTRCQMCRLKCCSDCLTAELELQEFGVLRVCAACLKFSPHAKRALKQEDKDHLYNTMRLDGMLPTPPTKFTNPGPPPTTTPGMATICMRCRQRFSQQSPESHVCICCKGIFCDACSTHLGGGSWELLGVFLSSRVCMACYDKYQVGQPDACSRCRQPFAGRHQHQCCHCRRLFCDPCAPRRPPLNAELFGNLIPMRLCDACFEKTLPEPGPTPFAQQPANEARPPSLIMIDGFTLRGLGTASLPATGPFAGLPPLGPTEDVAPGADYLDHVFFIFEDSSPDEEEMDDLSERVLYFYPSCIVRSTRLLVAGVVEQICAVSAVLQPAQEEGEHEPCVVRLMTAALVVGRIGSLRVAFGARVEVPDPVLVSHFELLRQAVAFYFGPGAFTCVEGPLAAFHERVVRIASTLCSLLTETLHHPNPLRALHPTMYWPLTHDLQAQVGQCVAKCSSGLRWAAGALFLDEFVLWTDVPPALLPVLQTLLHPKAQHAAMFCSPETTEEPPLEDGDDNASLCSTDSEVDAQVIRKRRRSAVTPYLVGPSLADVSDSDTWKGLDNARQWFHAAHERTLFCTVWPPEGVLGRRPPPQGSQGSPSPSPPGHLSSFAGFSPGSPMGLYLYSHARLTLILFSPTSTFAPAYSSLQLTHNRLLLALRRVLEEAEQGVAPGSGERFMSGTPLGVPHLGPTFATRSPEPSRQTLAGTKRWQVTDQHVSYSDQRGSHSLVQAVMHSNLQDHSIRYFGSVELPFLDTSVLAQSLMGSHHDGCALILHRKRRPVVFAQVRERISTVCHIDGLEHDVTTGDGEPGQSEGAPRRLSVLELVEDATARAFKTVESPLLFPGSGAWH